MEETRSRVLCDDTCKFKSPMRENQVGSFLRFLGRDVMKSAGEGERGGQLRVPNTDAGSLASDRTDDARVNSRSLA
jgi:hypothetical protein